MVNPMMRNLHETNLWALLEAAVGMVRTVRLCEALVVHDQLLRPRQETVDRAELAQALIELARLDRALKTGQAEPPDLHLELALRRICGVAPAAGTSAPRPPAAVSNRGGAE